MNMESSTTLIYFYSLPLGLVLCVFRGFLYDWRNL